MEYELAQIANALRRGSAPSGPSQAVADDNFNMHGLAMGSAGVATSSNPPLQITPDIVKIYSQWALFKERLMALDFGGKYYGATAPPPVAPPLLDGLSWEATVPVRAHSLVPTSPNATAGFTFAELRAVPAKPGFDDGELATSSNGRPVYGAYVVSSAGELRLQQLFDFSRTAFDAGVFVPIPTVAGHFQGTFGLNYSRYRVFGSIDSLPRSLRWPAPPISQVSANQLAASHVHHELAVQVMGRDPAAESILVAPSYDDCADSSFVSNLALPSAAHDYSVLTAFSPAPVASAPPVLLPQRVSEPVPSAFSGCKEVENQGAGIKRKSSVETEETTHMVAKRLPDRCHPCFLCAACAEYWGTTGLPRSYFGNPEEKFFRLSPEEDVAPDLSSEATALRKRKWHQARHGPKSKTSQYRGVNLYKRTNKWEAHIWTEGEQIYLGASITKVHAAQVFDRAALFIFGPDTEINFKPEGYQEEFAFMRRLTYGQMVVYLRRESRQSGEEVRYPGVAKLSAKVFAASYRPRKEKESHEHIGLFKTEDDAVRAVMKEAKSRSNYEMAGRLMDVHHLRTVRPAPGKIKQTARARGVVKVPAIKVPVTGPANAPNRPPAKRAALEPKPATQTAGAVSPAKKTGAAPRKRNFAKKTTNSTASPTAMQTTSGPLTLEAATPVPEAARVKRKYTRKSKKTQDTNTPATSTPGPLQQDDIAGPVPATAAIVASTSEELGSAASRAERTYVRKNAKAKELVIAPVPIAVEASPGQEVGTGPKRTYTRRKNTATKSQPAPAEENTSTWVPIQFQQAVSSAPVTLEVPVEAEVPQDSSVLPLLVYDRPRPRKSAAPARAPAPLPDYPRTPRKATTPARFPGIFFTQVVPSVTPQPLPDVAPAAPPTPPAQVQAADSLAHPVVANQPPVSDSFLSFSSENSSDGAYAADSEGNSGSHFTASQDSATTESSCLSFQSEPVSNFTELSYQTPPPRRQPTEEDLRQIQEAWAMARRDPPRRPPNPLRPASHAPGASSGVIRPVARRLQLTQWMYDAGIGIGADLSANLFPQERGGGGHVYVDLFGPPNSPASTGGDGADSEEL